MRPVPSCIAIFATLIIVQETVTRMRTIIAGNWKMHTEHGTASALAEAVAVGLQGLSTRVEVMVAPPFPFLERVVSAVGSAPVTVAAQDCHEAESGAFTGDVSAPMLASLGVGACIVGHSERRQYHGETDAAVARKIAALHASGITAIYCCGERLEERQAGRHQEVVEAQVREALGGLPKQVLAGVVVAYEPVWAIGTGLTANAGQAQEMHAHIRNVLYDLGAPSTAVPILYGGSCKPDNAAELLACHDVDGGLIGGASLDPVSFLELVRIAARVKAL